MKTIKELNQKWWYRLLKVVYVFFALIFSFLVSIMMPENGIKEVLFSESKPSLISENNFTQRDLDFLKRAKEKGMTFNDAMFNLNEARRINGLSQIINEKETVKSVSLDNNLIIKIGIIPIFSITITYLLFFQFLNRVFYYIILGTFYPSDTINLIKKLNNKNLSKVLFISLGLFASFYFPYMSSFQQSLRIDSSNIAYRRLGSDTLFSFIIFLLVYNFIKSENKFLSFGLGIVGITIFCIIQLQSL